jgi:hypothetical protein
VVEGTPVESEGVKAEEAYQKEEEKAPEIVDEYLKSQTLEDYLASKKKTVVAKKEIRQVEETKKANLEKVESSKAKTSTIDNVLRAAENYNAGLTKPTTNSLLGF